MHKVMTRAQRRPGTHPPGRQDARRPGGTPPRPPGGTLLRAPADGRPPGPPGGGSPAQRGPADGRPPTAPARPTTTPRPGTTGHHPAPGHPAAPLPAQTDTTSNQPTGSGSGAGLSTRSGRPGPTTAAAPARRPAPPSRPDSRTHGDGTAAAARVVAAQAAPRPLPHPATTDLFAERLLAVLSGQRPVHWMLRHTAGRAYDELARLAERGPLRTRGARPVVRDIGYYEPRPGALEAFARIGAGDRLRAMAFRLEQGRDLRWRCTAVELGGPRVSRTDDD
ncbi:Rv3235 family protein [Streptomyces sp. NPDC046831]|uniref:Rv3235 family protein n=1 Tax=Streptomyces sp. NPDC046831 TaxID=3154805 RepID=UPI0033FA07D6